jgi:hypothetical protein
MMSCARSRSASGVNVIKLHVDANLTSEDCIDMLFNATPERKAWDSSAQWEKKVAGDKDGGKGGGGGQKYALLYKVPMLPAFKLDVQAGGLGDNVAPNLIFVYSRGKSADFEVKRGDFISSLDIHLNALYARSMCGCSSSGTFPAPETSPTRTAL